MAECKRRNIEVHNTPDVASDSAAEFTVTLILLVARRLLEGKIQNWWGHIGIKKNTPKNKKENLQNILGGEKICLTEKPRHNTDVGSSPHCSRTSFSQSQLLVQALLQCPYSPCVQSNASASVHMLKVRWKYTKILHILIGMGSSALVAAVLYPGEAFQISHKGQ